MKFIGHLFQLDE